MVSRGRVAQARGEAVREPVERDQGETQEDRVHLDLARITEDVMHPRRVTGTRGRWLAGDEDPDDEKNGKLDPGAGELYRSA